MQDENRDNIEAKFDESENENTGTVVIPGSDDNTAVETEKTQAVEIDEAENVAEEAEVVTSEDEMTATSSESASDTSNEDTVAEDAGSIEEEAVEITAEETEALTEQQPEKPKKKGIGKKILKGIGILLIVGILALGCFVGYRVWDYLQVYVYTQTHTIPVTLSSDSISLNIESVEFIDEIVGFELDENYVYLGVKYTITNDTQSSLEWKKFPLLMVREYVADEDNTGYVLVEGTDQAYEMTGLRNYGIELEIDFRVAKDNLPAGESRVSADIFKILKTDYETKTYFLTTDIVDELVELPPLEVPEISGEVGGDTPQE